MTGATAKGQSDGSSKDRDQPMNQACPLTHSQARPPTDPAQLLARRLAASGLAVHSTSRQDRCQILVLDLADARCCLTLTGDASAQWHYEPSTGPGTDAATVIAIITHILGAPRAADTISGTDAYQAFPLKGKVGRCLQDRGLTVILDVSEDLESFEVTAEIEVTSPAHPWLGAVRLADDATLEWDCDWRAAFHDDPARLIDILAPILR